MGDTREKANKMGRQTISGGSSTGLVCCVREETRIGQTDADSLTGQRQSKEYKLANKTYPSEDKFKSPHNKDNSQQATVATWHTNTTNHQSQNDKWKN